MDERDGEVVGRVYVMGMYGGEVVERVWVMGKDGGEVVLKVVGDGDRWLGGGREVGRRWWRGGKEMVGR